MRIEENVLLIGFKTCVFYFSSSNIYLGIILLYDTFLLLYTCSVLSTGLITYLCLPNQIKYAEVQITVMSRRQLNGTR